MPCRHQSRGMDEIRLKNTWICGRAKGPMSLEVSSRQQILEITNINVPDTNLEVVRQFRSSYHTKDHLRSWRDRFNFSDLAEWVHTNRSDLVKWVHMSCSDLAEWLHTSRSDLAEWVHTSRYTISNNTSFTNRGQIQVLY